MRRRWLSSRMQVALVVAGLAGVTATSGAQADSAGLDHGVRRDSAAAPAAVPGAAIPRAPSWRRTARNAEILTGIGVVSLGVIWALPERISMWSPEQKTLRHWKEAYTSPPVWDHDPVVFNYVLHPLTGMYVYQMERNQGSGPVRSFLLSTAASVAWEYGFEAPIEHPSATDLVVTSPVGSLLGEAGYRVTMRMRRGGWTPWKRVAALVTDPVWVLQQGYR